MSKNRYIVVLEFQLRSKIDGAGDIEKDGARLASVVMAQCPSKSSRDEVIIGAVVKACHIAHLSPTSSSYMFAIAVGSGECQLLCMGVDR